MDWFLLFCFRDYDMDMMMVKLVDGLVFVLVSDGWVVCVWYVLINEPCFCCLSVLGIVLNDDETEPMESFVYNKSIVYVFED